MIIVYPVPELLPDPRARFIQIVNTCRALAEAGAKVKLLAGIKKNCPAEDVLRFYGLSSHPNLEIIRLPMLRGDNTIYLRLSWHGIFHLSFLLYLLFKLPSKAETVLFLRHIKLANFMLTLKKFLNIPIVFEMHEVFHLNTLNKKKKKILENLETKVYKNVDTLICLSKSLEQYIIDMMIRRSAYVVPHAVKEEWFNIERDTSGSYICYTGGLYTWKGVDTLISAMKYLQDERLTIVGSGGRLEELKNLAELEGVAGKIHFAGAVPHNAIPEYLSKAKIAVLPNTMEGPSLLSSPLKLFEYMACGVPIVASNIPALMEILVDGENAVLFESGNAEALAHSIKKLSGNRELALKLSAAARKDAKNYTYAVRAKKIIKALQDSKLVRDNNKI